MWRAIIFLLIIFCLFNQFFWVAGALFLWYALRYSGYELLFLAILLDGYYGAFYSVPLLTLGTFGVWLAADSLKKLLLLYTGKNETIS